MARCAVLIASVVLVLALQAAHGSEEKKKYDKCLAEKKCETASCDGACKGDNWNYCLAMCRLNCNCACLGLAQGKLDAFDSWQKCANEQGCESKHDACKAKCADKECRDACVLEQDKCMCRCNA
ncbi:Tissue factor pathway inhibitor [Frankliniella fusca]|uniref:Tissue factor pathway inhibitor n=1 Tax=Frankliniella fusca TaxID=407009 RepID=A0AAE1LI51_9NEOP|nr:Tissue factor pathway inhibitor [Frankliniella fusca]